MDKLGVRKLCKAVTHSVMLLTKKQRHKSYSRGAHNFEFMIALVAIVPRPRSVVAIALFSRGYANIPASHVQ